LLQLLATLTGCVEQPPADYLAQATPTADTAMFYFYTNHLHFTPEFLGRVRLSGAVASLAGWAHSSLDGHSSGISVHC